MPAVFVLKVTNIAEKFHIGWTSVTSGHYIPPKIRHFAPFSRFSGMRNLLTILYSLTCTSARRTARLICVYLYYNVYSRLAF